MQVEATRNYNFLVSGNIKKGDVLDVLLYIKPTDAYELVLVKRQAGARRLDTDDEILYQSPNFHGHESLYNANFSNYCWLKINTSNPYNDEVKFVNFTENSDATILLRKGF